MSQAPSIALAGTTEDNHVEGAANVALRGTARGLENLEAFPDELLGQLAHRAGKPTLDHRRVLP